MTAVHCATCGTELAPTALACPACGSLVHAESLKELAAAATRAAQDGRLAEARSQLEQALARLPPHAQQHHVVRERIVDLTRRLESSGQEKRAGNPNDPWWRRGLAGIVTVGVLLFSKLKFLLLGLTKASTFISMFAFFGVYWSTYGWPLALGLVVSIYIHEMGHVAMLRRLGIEAGAPLFIPGVGALVMLRQHVTDPLTDAKIGLAGPVWGLGAALAALLAYAVTQTPIWLAIAQLTGFLNLFNLIPIWQLDGSRGMHVLARWERWTLVAVIAAVWLVTEQPMLFLVGAVAVWRALQKETGPGDAGVLATFSGLVVALAWLARDVGSQ